MGQGVRPMTLIATRSGIAQFRGVHAGQDVYILGAGPSLNYLDPAFFDGKTVVAVNSSARTFGIRPAYVVVKEHVEEAVPNAQAFPDVPIICSRGPYGNADQAWPEFDQPNVYVYDHLPNRATEFDAIRDWPTDPDSLVVSMSTITSAMHFAAYSGAANILVVGHDCGRLGDDLYVTGYPDAEPAWMPEWLQSIERQSLAVKRELVRRYGCRVYGLSPFITPNLDGVAYRGSNRINAW